MDPDVWQFAVVMCIIVGSVGGLACIGTLTFRALWRPKRQVPLPQQNYDERFAQLQQSVDAIAVEVERIAEGQRFSTKLLADGARSNAITETR
ncbi:MAG TPA: hypothetical protein VII66_08235 [Gemmatimonadaceae bacterium]